MTALLTLEQAAQALGYSASGFRKLLRSGRGPRFLRVQPRGHYRFRPSDLDDWTESLSPAPLPQPKRQIETFPGFAS
ncbi:MAG: helix-turn-helix domain-containing protein [Pirellulales bacterium]